MTDKQIAMIESAIEDYQQSYTNMEHMLTKLTYLIFELSECKEDLDMQMDFLKKECLDAFGENGLDTEDITHLITNHECESVIEESLLDKLGEVKRDLRYQHEKKGYVTDDLFRALWKAEKN